ncbi:hypothetical protein ABIA69_003352 [Lysinibacillus parviboronicapiens]|uniref:Uncharacterized protein n=1 Tax=Lysinibacillus parviboronicapiens TaxID=436516 RepID=A0ABV2PMK1_9BACI
MVQLNTLPAGSIINFAGRNWVLLNPSLGFIYMKDSLTKLAFDTGGSQYFTPSDNRNIGYYLNTTYYNTLIEVEKDLIVTNSWGIGSLSVTEGGVGTSTPSLTLAQMKAQEDGNLQSAKIGLLSVSEWRSYSKAYNKSTGIIDAPLAATAGTRLRTPASGSGTNVWSAGEQNGLLSNTVDTKLATSIYPALKLKPTANVVNGIVVGNTVPTVSLTGPSENQTLYENDTFNISGTAHDADADQSVTAYYQVNSEPKKVLATNLSQTQIALSKQLTFKAGKLYDGETAITGSLADGIAHKLKVWAEDSEKASSAIVEKSFYVVPNRAPLLSVDAVVPSGVVDADKFKISGTSSDPDANSSVTVTRRINNGNSVEIYNGPGGAWGFDISLAQLVVGANTIVVEVVDNYGAKASKTITLNKNEVKSPILQSVARYKVEPPKGSAKGVLLWVQREEEVDLTVEISMTLKGEQESYVPLIATNTAPVYEGVLEDEFYHETLEPKDNIILKFTTARPNVNIDNKIYLIMGVLE